MFNILYLQMYWCMQEFYYSPLHYYFGFQDIQDKRKEKKK